MANGADLSPTERRRAAQAWCLREGLTPSGETAAMLAVQRQWAVMTGRQQMANVLGEQFREVGFALGWGDDTGGGDGEEAS